LPRIHACRHKCTARLHTHGRMQRRSCGCMNSLRTVPKSIPGGCTSSNPSPPANDNEVCSASSTSFSSSRPIGSPASCFQVKFDRRSLIGWPVLHTRNENKQETAIGNRAYLQFHETISESQFVCACVHARARGCAFVCVWGSPPNDRYLMATPRNAPKN
jgi:hypothetical protein